MIISASNMLNAGNFMIGGVFISNHDAVKVINDVMPKISTFISPDETGPNDLEIIKSVILPVFFTLYQTCPEAYNLLMKNELRIGIVTFKHDDLFYIKRTKRRTPAALLTDRSAVCLNLYDKFEKSHLIHSLFHELMHLVGIRITGGKKLGEVLDEKLKGKLTAISANYMKRFKTAIGKLETYHKEKYTSVKDFYNYYDRVMHYEKCWVQKRISRQEISVSAERCKFETVMPDDAEELLAWGLEFYYNSKEDREFLCQQEPELFKIIKEQVIPLLKKKIA